MGTKETLKHFLMKKKRRLIINLRSAVFIYIEPDPSEYSAGCTVLFKKTLSRYLMNRHNPTYKKSIFMMEIYNRLSDYVKSIFLLRIELVNIFIQFLREQRPS